MSKFLAVMIGIGLVLGAVSVSFAQDSSAPKMAPKKAKKAKKAKTTDTAKK
jgi:hypothetical protein